MLSQTIQNAVSQIRDTCSREAVFVTEDMDRHLPNRGEIIGIIKNLRRVIFPGYFGNENIASSMPDYFLGNMMTEIYVSLKQQVETAFIYNQNGDPSDPKISERAEQICRAFISRLPYIQKMLLMDIQAGFDAGAHDEGLLLDEQTGGPAQLKGDFRHNGRNNAAFQGIGIDFPDFQDGFNHDRIFRGRFVPVGGNPLDKQDFSFVNTAQDNVGIAHIYGKDHLRYS